MLNDLNLRKSQKNLIAVGLAAILLLLIFFFLDFGDAGTASAPPPAPARNVAHSVPVKPRTNQDTELIGELTSGGPGFTAENVATYFKIYGINEKTLTAAWWLTGDIAYLQKLGESAGDYLPAVATLALSGGSPNERELWSKKLIELEPQCRSGYLCLMRALVDGGDIVGAMAALNKANESEKESNFETAALLDQREAWQSTGTSSLTAKVRVLSSNVTSAMTTHAKLALKKLWKQSIEGKNEDEQVSLATPFLSAASAFSSSKTAETQTRFTRITAEKEILKSLPPDTEYGNTGLSLKQRIEELDSEFSSNAQEVERVKEALGVATPERLDLFMQRLDTMGFEQAQKWLLSQ